MGACGGAFVIAGRVCCFDWFLMRSIDADVAFLPPSTSSSGIVETGLVQCGDQRAEPGPALRGCDGGKEKRLLAVMHPHTHMCTRDAS